MSQQHHVIKKQYLDLYIGSNIKAFDLQNQISALYRSKIIPLLEAYCDRLSESDSILRIETLNIDLGEIDLQTLETDFVETFEKHLSQQLAENINSSIASQSVQLSPQTKVAKQPSLVAPTTSQLELFSYFLQTGRLPWWSTPLSQSALEDCCDDLLKASPPAFKAFLQTQLKQKNPLQRLIYQFPDATLISLVNLLASTEVEWVTTYIQDIQTLKPQVHSLQQISRQHFRLRLWQGIFAPLLLTSTLPSQSETGIQHHLLYLATSFQISLPTLRQQMLSALGQCHNNNIHCQSDLPTVLTKLPKTTVNPATAFQTVLDQLIHILQELSDLNHIKSSPSSLRNNIDALLSQLNTVLTNIQNNTSNFIPTQALLTQLKTLVTDIEIQQQPTYYPLIQSLKITDQVIKTRTNSLDFPAISDSLQETVTLFSKSDEIYIQNAGLILLWPFLTHFFESLHLIQTDQFLDSEATEQSVLILQYLVETSIEAPEQLLLLNKLLCGLELSTPIATHLEITDLKINECHTLLTAVIHNWSALKNITPEGFRKAFLQRPGILRSHNSSNWLLQVEQKSYDILLKHLPWSIHVVKLPWMSNILHVEW